eukprot:TRINITY_DN26552_c0_g1_i1.p1 TRINITY_DN26552_c0_g1~~TRINITY_DN26552_c0_g1_i1.p1  ORF type:complete len:405 (-),score=74.14 TRINITY_DN26552_c0_g1_i1:166-1380(-)
MSDDRVKMECPHCGYKSVPQWLNDQAHCLKCQAVLKTRGSGAAVNESRRAPGEVSTHKHSASSAMESQSGTCSASPDGVHHWKFGKCNYCQVSEGKLVAGSGVMPNPGGAGGCEKGGKCMFKFGKCTKCHRVEGALSSPAPRRSAAPARRTELSDKVTEIFRRFDKNGDGTIDKNELKQILEQLHKGEFTDAQVESVLQQADTNQDGKVDYEEWAAWVTHPGEGADVLQMGEAEQRARPAAKSAAAPAAKSVAAPAAVSSSGHSDGGDVQGVQDAFQKYCAGSRDMDGKTFIKICKDVGLVDRKFTPTDCDLIFAKVVTKGQRRIDFHQFQNALRLIAERKGVDSVESIVAGSAGPILHGTHADAVRFHDDKSTYTGVHVNGGPESVAKGGGTVADASWKRPGP